MAATTTHATALHYPPMSAYPSIHPSATGIGLLFLLLREGVQKQQKRIYTRLCKA